MGHILLWGFLYIKYTVFDFCIEKYYFFTMKYFNIILKINFNGK